jgi:hypothetical protein
MKAFSADAIVHRLQQPIDALGNKLSKGKVKR